MAICYDNLVFTTQSTETLLM